MFNTIEVNPIAEVNPTIKNWSVKQVNYNIYNAPEINNLCVMGNIFNHPRFENDTLISTSAIKDTEGKIITTNSGNKYYIDGPPSIEYNDFCISNNIVIDLENPIKLISIKDIGNEPYSSNDV
jgi:hypothetical protein